MPLNSRYRENDYAKVISTYNSVIDTIRHSTNKNDAIRSLKDTTIEGTNIKIGQKYSHQIYNKYTEYNGAVGSVRRF